MYLEGRESPWANMKGSRADQDSGDGRCSASSLGGRSSIVAQTMIKLGRILDDAVSHHGVDAWSAASGFLAEGDMQKQSLVAADDP